MTVGKIYAVESRTRLCVGTYIGRVFEDEEDYILKDVMQKNKSNNKLVSYFMRKPIQIKHTAVFTPNDIVYDLEEIKDNGKKARQAMEQRTLNIVLKRLVNETFEW